MDYHEEEQNRAKNSLEPFPCFLTWVNSKIQNPWPEEEAAFLPGRILKHDGKHIHHYFPRFFGKGMQPICSGKGASGREWYHGFLRITEFTLRCGTQSTTMALLLRGETRESGGKWDSSLGPALRWGPGSREAPVITSLDHEYVWEQRYFVFDSMCPLVPLPERKKCASRQTFPTSW